MTWWKSLVQIVATDDLKGSGVFISPTEVLTAAHVVARGSTKLPVSELEVRIRYLDAVVAPDEVALLPRFAPNDAGSDIALLRISAQEHLGVPAAFEIPPASESRVLGGFGFDAESDRALRKSGLVECKSTSDGELYLYSGDFAPTPGMSGGPLCMGKDGGVRVTGILTRKSESGFIGLSLVSSVLAALRSQL